jgi:hypothetical protein
MRKKTLRQAVEPHLGVTCLPADGYVPVELLLATPSVVIVDVVVEFPDDQQTAEFGLVIPRGQCQGNNPHVKTLLEAARELVRRLATALGQGAQRAGRVLARVAGQPVALWG